MKYIKKFENIDWDNEWDFEESIDELSYPIVLSKLNNTEFISFFRKLKVGNKFLFSFKKHGIEYKNIIGEIKNLKNHIGIEFEENIDGHNGFNIRGRDGYCWYFNYKTDYNLVFIKQLK